MNLLRKKTVEDFRVSVKKSGLKKGLSSLDLAALGIGSMVGTGVFVSIGQGAQLAGPAVIISFTVAAITSALCALTYSELATMFPVAGSTYSYCYVAFGEIIASDAGISCFRGGSCLWVVWNFCRGVENLRHQFTPPAY